jgi:hypothetical protein
MMKIALELGQNPSPVWTLARQAGVEHAVVAINLNPIPNAGEEQQPWSYMSLARLKATYEDAGFQLAAFLETRFSCGLDLT